VLGSEFPDHLPCGEFRVPPLERTCRRVAFRAHHDVTSTSRKCRLQDYIARRATSSDAFPVRCLSTLPCIMAVRVAADGALR
jgi:hypothetical protein